MLPHDGESLGDQVEARTVGGGGIGSSLVVLAHVIEHQTLAASPSGVDENRVHVVERPLRAPEVPVVFGFFEFKPRDCLQGAAHLHRELARGASRLHRVFFAVPVLDAARSLCEGRAKVVVRGDEVVGQRLQRLHELQHLHRLLRHEDILIHVWVLLEILLLPPRSLAPLRHVLLDFLLPLLHLHLSQSALVLKRRGGGVHQPLQVRDPRDQSRDPTVRVVRPVRGPAVVAAAQRREHAGRRPDQRGGEVEQGLGVCERRANLLRLPRG